MAERIIDATQFNVNTDIMYTAPKATPQGAKSVNILNKKTKTGLTLSTPLMLTWGASDYKAEGETVGNGKFELSLQFPSEEYKSADTSAFLNNMKDLEDKIKADALLYSKEWFGKVHKSPDVVEALWTPMLKYSKNKVTGEHDHTKSPTLRVKIPQWEGTWKCEIYDEDGGKLYPSIENPNVTPLDYLKKGSNIACLIQFGGIWFVNGKFSASWKLVQAVVQKPRATLQGQCFIKLKAQDKEKLQNQTVVDDDADDHHVNSTIVEDSDADEDEPVEPVVQRSSPPSIPVPSPAPAPAEQEVEEEKPKKVVKKIVRK
jgi:hypothetical protein